MQRTHFQCPPNTLSDRKLRESSISALQSFISTRHTLSALDAQKLWTGLYYAHWMTDRPKPQQQLANDLSALLFLLPDPAPAKEWLRAFWHVLGVQWTSIEALRLDKFLLLVRRVFAAQLRYAKQHDYKDDVILDVLKEFCFDGEGGSSGLGVLPLGLRLHIMDLWVDELEREEILEDEDAKEFLAEIGKLVDALRTSPVKGVRERARDTYEDERLPFGEHEDGDDEEWGGIDG